MAIKQSKSPKPAQTDEELARKVKVFLDPLGQNEAYSQRFNSVPGSLWCVKVTLNGETKNLFLTAPTMPQAIAQAKSVNPSYKIEEATQAEFVLCAPAPVTIVMWVPKKSRRVAAPLSLGSQRLRPWLMQTVGHSSPFLS